MAAPASPTPPVPRFTPAALEVHAIEIAFGTTEILRGVSFSLARGRIGCVLGPSGCGKTTLLRALAGFESISGGAIRINGTTVAEVGHTVPPESRRIGMVFQDYALFPHLSVLANIEFGLHKLKPTARTARARAMLDAVGLAAEAAKYPHELSGGQQQRIALARALAPEPELLLLDEPFSNLDIELRERLALEVRAIIKRAGITAVLVTHDQHEAFAIADDIGIMAEGAIQQWDNAYNLYHRPATRFIAHFIGQGVFLPGRIAGADKIEIELGMLHANVPAHAGPIVDVLLRPDDVVHDDESSLKAEVIHKAFRGSQFLYTLRLRSGATILASVHSHHDHAIGEPIGIRLAVDHVVAFPRAANAPGTLSSLP